MNKSTAIEKAGSVRELAAILEITTQAIHQWKDGATIPKPSLKLLRLKRPSWFKPDKGSHATAGAQQ